jgi:hypothetical protein
MCIVRLDTTWIFLIISQNYCYYNSYFPIPIICLLVSLHYYCTFQFHNWFHMKKNSNLFLELWETNNIWNTNKRLKVITCLLTFMSSIWFESFVSCLFEFSLREFYQQWKSLLIYLSLNVMEPQYYAMFNLELF